MLLLICGNGTYSVEVTFNYKKVLNRDSRSVGSTDEASGHTDSTAVSAAKRLALWKDKIYKIPKFNIAMLLCVFVCLCGAINFLNHVTDC